MSETFPHPVSGSGGEWTCARCLSRVPSGAFHSCNYPPSPQTDMQRIASALERIAALLERMNEREAA